MSGDLLFEVVAVIAFEDGTMGCAPLNQIRLTPPEFVQVEAGR